MSFRAKRRRGLATTSLMLFLAARMWSGQSPSQPETNPNKIFVTVNAVLVPVVVRDAQGKAIGNLKKEDFEVFDKNKSQTIVGFDVQRRTAPATEPGKTHDSTVGPNSSDSKTDALQALVPERFVVFLFDDAHLNPGDLSLIQKAGTKITSDSLAASDMAAVVATSGVSSGLTRDRVKLQDTIMKLRVGDVYRHAGRACPQMTYYEADRIMNRHDFMTLETAIEDTLACCDCKRDVAETLAQNAASETLHVGDQDVRQTLGFIREIVRKMGTMPGQRTLILISPGFLTVAPEAMIGKSEVLDIAARSNVTINAMDARGLYTTTVDASEQNRGSASAERDAAQYRGYALTLNEDVMAELAGGTGGTFFHNSNDLEGGLQRLTVVPEWVYVLEFSPTGVKLDGSYHPLRVSVKGEGLKIEARQGYFASRPQKSKTPK
jgi:VWFA-related protein